MYLNKFNNFKEIANNILHYLKKISFFLMILIFFLCCSTFKIKKATYQIWCDPEKKLKGTNYHVVLKSYSNYKKVSIDSIYVQNEWKRCFHYSVLGSSNTDTCFNKYDEIILSIFVKDTINITGFKVAFSKNGRKKIITVKNFIPLKNLCKK